MSVKAEKKERVHYQDCGHDRFILIDGAKRITKCDKCNIYYQLLYVKEQVPITVVDPKSSVVPYSVPRRFVTRYITTTVQKWVPYII